MICLSDQLPLLTYGPHQVVHYESRWLKDSIIAAAAKAGHDDWWFAADIARAVIEYLRARFSAATITVDELYDKIDRVLKHMGWDDIAAALVASPPPLRLSLIELAEEAGEGYEMAFFRLLEGRLQGAAETGCEQIHLFGLRPAIKHLNAAQRWSHDCDVLCDQVVDFLRMRLQAHGENIGLVVR